MTTKSYGVGVVGCGSISAAYLGLIPRFRGLEVRAVADIDPNAAALRAKEFNVPATTVDELISSDDIDVVLNLTVPRAHYDISVAAIGAGKHVYSEKPLVLTVQEGHDLKKAADAAGVRVGCAPDTFLGGAHQLARQVVDSGAIGRISSGTCHVMGPGMEMWHPNPDFFFKPGGGPVLDMGPYYVAALINLIGPVSRVVAMSGKAQSERSITTGRRIGETITVETPTTVHAVLEFASGSIVTLGASWDVWSHGHHNIELYGTEGSLFVPDPNLFGGIVEQTSRDGRRTAVPGPDHPLGTPNLQLADGSSAASYRGAGLADMVQAIDAGHRARCSLEVGLHSLDVMTSILLSAEHREAVTLTTTCERPEALDPAEAAGLLNL